MSRGVTSSPLLELSVASSPRMQHKEVGTKNGSSQIIHRRAIGSMVYIITKMNIHKQESTKSSSF